MYPFQDIKTMSISTLSKSLLPAEFIRFARKVRDRYKLIHFLFVEADYETEDLRKGKAPANLDVISIAYNNVWVIEFQIKLIAKYLMDHHKHIVADNSSDPDRAAKIRQLCHENGIGYVKIPDNPFKRNRSHAAAMHWTYKNVVKKRNTEFYHIKSLCQAAIAPVPLLGIFRLSSSCNPAGVMVYPF